MVIARKKRGGGGAAKKMEWAVKVKVVGVGGGGGNAISRMYHDFPRGVEFIAVNTDAQDLELTSARRRIHIGQTVTGGMGAGMNPELGARAAEEDRTEIAEALKGADLVFLTAGFGGGTGTGAMPVVAEVAREQGALTVAVVTKPFAFEGTQRARIAQEGIIKLRDKVDALIIIPNDRIFSIIEKDTPIIKAFAEIDEVLKRAVQGIVDLITSAGIINVDFADVKAVMAGAGSAIVGVGVASGQERCTDAVRQALNSPLLEVTPDGAKGVLFGVSGGRDLKMTEINEAAKIITEAVDPGAKIIFGAYHDRRLKQGQVKVMLIATGFADARPVLGTLFGSESRGASGGNIFKRMVEPATPEPTVKKEPALTSGLETLKPELTVSGMQARREAENNNKEEKEKAESMWDIPTFLRRKKK